jgi:hypothetical protein
MASAPDFDESAFDAWFGASKAMAENGSPLVLYHGTAEAFERFEDFTGGEDGFYFSSSPAVASGYAKWRGDMIDNTDTPNAPGPNVVPVHLSLQNPMIIDGASKPFSAELFQDTIDAARDAGHDGVIVRNVDDRADFEQSELADTYIVFNPEQVMSKFDPAALSVHSHEVAPAPSAKEGDFDEWFEGSQAVAEDGSPLVLYHGTDAAEFAAFAPGSWFSDNADESSAYSFAVNVARRDRSTGKYRRAKGPEYDGQMLPYWGTLSDMDQKVVGDIYATDNGVFRYRGKGNWDAFDDLVVDYDNLSDDTWHIRVVAGDASAQIDELIDEYEGMVQSAWPGGDGGRVAPVYLSIKNPIKLPAMEANRISKRLGADDAEIAAKIAEYEAQGYDGIVTVSDEATMWSDVRERLGGIPQHWVAFRPEQVRSRFEPGVSYDRNHENAKVDKEATFEEWFAASKVADETGAPKVVYHGTGGHFDRFETMAWASEGTDLPWEYAAFRAGMSGDGAQLMPLYLRIEHPFDADYGLPKTVTISMMVNEMVEQAQAQGRDHMDDETVLQQLRDLIDKLGDCRRREESGPHYARHDFWNETSSLFGPDGAAAITEIFEILGFDGITMLEGGERTWGAFSPDQVMSRFDERALPLQIAPTAPDAEARAFDEWFGNSMVSDDLGRPMKVFHGTADDIDELRLGGSQRHGHGRQMEGIYFSCYEGTAKAYARSAANAQDATRDDDGVVITAYVSLQKPKIYDDPYPFKYAIRQELEAAGYDGAVRLNDFGRMVEIVAFRPEQVKEVSRTVDGRPQATRVADPEPQDEAVLAPAM